MFSKALRAGTALLLIFLLLFSLLGGAQAKPAFPGGGMAPGMEPEEEEAEEEEPWDGYRHSTYRGIAFGTKWNYSLTFAWGSRALWLYGDGSKLLFRQVVESGEAYEILRLTLWIQGDYDELALCVEAADLQLLADSGIQEIAIKTDYYDRTQTRGILYQVDDLLALMEQAGVEAENTLQIWAGETAGPQVITKAWQRIQLDPEDDPGQAL